MTHPLAAFFVLSREGKFGPPSQRMADYLRFCGRAENFVRTDTVRPVPHPGAK